MIEQYHQIKRKVVPKDLLSCSTDALIFKFQHIPKMHHLSKNASQDAKRKGKLLFRQKKKGKSEILAKKKTIYDLILCS